MNSAALAELVSEPISGNIPDDCHPQIKQLVAHWVSIHPPQGLPGRQHFDPRDVRGLLANLRLLDVSGNPPRFQVRLFGTRLVEFFGRDLTGHFYDEAFDGFIGSRTEKDFLTSMATGQPSWRRGKPLFMYEKEFQTVERVILPLAADGCTVDMLLNMQLFIQSD